MLGIEEEADSLSSSANSDYPAWSYSSSASVPLKTMNTLGYYLQDQIKLFDRSFTTLGVRYDDNNRFGGHETWRANELYTIKETGTRLKASYGTGFKAPTLNQLYDTIYGTGNLNLKPETSRGWDVGIELDVFKKFSTVGISYFENAFSNLIQANAAPYVNQNVSKAKANGIETFMEMRPLTDLTLRSTYTYQDAKNLDTGNQLLRRPRNKASFDTDYRFLEKAHVHVNVLMVGQKADYASTVAGYVMLNFAGSYDVHKNVQIFGRIDNVLNKQYQEVYGYGTSSIAGYGGVKVSY